MIESGGRQFWLATLALCIGSFMTFANVYITQPLLPMIADAFDLTVLEANGSFTITTLMLGLSLLIYGPLSDAVGRKPIMLISLVGATACTLLLTQVESYSALVALRAAQGFFLGGLPAVAIAYMGDEFSPKALLFAVGLYIGGNSLGGIGGRLIGGFVGEAFSWRSAFVAMTIVSVLCLIVFALMLPNSRGFTRKPLRPRQMLADLGGHLRNPILLTCYLIGGLNFFIFINQYSYIIFVLEDAPFNLSAQYLGLLFLTYLAGTVGSSLSGKIALKVPQPLCIALGVAILMSGTLLTLAQTLPTIIAGLLINSFGFFLAHSSASSLVNRSARGAKASASSLYLVFYYLGASSGGFYLHPFWSALGWDGVVLGSMLVLTGVLGAAIWLYRRECEPVGEPDVCV
ncbi:MFS transporter [Hahella sp. HN01]|uniref:MFS transporter n=1 Tax=Hahella sp. HN01 TaxID=2847262 RepID=UPI001C1ED02D|nr:MFS transporter [Hahella sp. HN01]MBU6951026.1 MFS transporter [Hahella sp. HN01]